MGSSSTIVAFVVRTHATVTRLIQLPDDTACDTVTKHLLFYFSIVWGLIQIPFLIVSLDDSDHYHSTSSALGAAGCALVITLLLLRRSTTAAIVVMCAFFAASLTAWDIAEATLSRTRYWPMYIVLIDFLLVVDRPRFASAVAVGVVCYIILTDLESLIRFGLYDLPYLPSAEERRQICDCTDPPCAPDRVVATAAAVANSIVVFVVNFFATGAFAHNAAKERRAVQASVDAAQHVAGCLARFDLYEAERVLKKTDDLPQPLAEGLTSLLSNLRTYRPYLPQSCLPYAADPLTAEGCSGLAGSGGVAALATPATPAPATFGESCLPSSDGSPAGTPRDGHGVPFEVALGGRSSPTLSRSTPSFRRSVSSRPEGACSLRFADAAAASVGGLPTEGGLSVRSVSLVAFSLRLASNAVEADPTKFVAQQGGFLGAVLQEVAQCRGIVDLFLADTVRVSFNASRPCACYSNAACTVARKLADTYVAPPLAALSGSIVTGQAHVGVVGTSEMCRLLIVGQLNAALDTLVSLGSYVGSQLLCNRVCYSDVSGEVALRVLLHSFTGDSSPDLVFELIGGAIDSETGEWMYNLQRAPGKAWEAYNEAGFMFLRGNTTAARELLDKATEERQHDFRVAARAAQVIDFGPRSTSRVGGGCFALSSASSAAMSSESSDYPATYSSMGT